MVSYFFSFFMEHLPDASSSCKLFLWIWRLQVMLFLSVAWQQKGKNRCGDEWRWARGRQEERKERGGELESQALVVIFSFSGFCGSLHFPSRTLKKKKVMWCAAERWMITSVVKTFHTNVLKSLLTLLETFFSKSCVRQVFNHVQV